MYGHVFCVMMHYKEGAYIILFVYNVDETMKVATNQLINQSVLMSAQAIHAYQK